MRRIFLGLLLLTLIPMGSEAQKAPMSLLAPAKKSQIIVKNRVLAKVNQKPVTVLDVMRKMDMVFYKQFPQYATSSEARFQFYQSSWKQVLQEIVDKELILADAAQVEMKLSDSDVRKELEEMFGPNVAVNLDKAGLSYDEARQLIQDDIILRRMMYMRVHSKALTEVTPQQVRGAYSKYLDEYERADEWHFHVITIRDPSAANLAKLAEAAPVLLNQETVEIDAVKTRLTKAPGYSPFTSIKVSDLFEQKESDLSEKFKAPLAQLSLGEYSPALMQVKEGKPADTLKILYLKDIIVDEYPSFAEMAPKLKNAMLGSLSEGEGLKYKKKLRKQFPVTIMDELLASDFEPFALEQVKR